MNLNLFKTTNYIIFRPLQRRKNEPKTNPITHLLIYVLFFLIFTNFYTNSPPVWTFSTLHSDENANFHQLQILPNKLQIHPFSYFIKANFLNYNSL